MISFDEVCIPNVKTVKEDVVQNLSNEIKNQNPMGFRRDITVFLIGSPFEQGCSLIFFISNNLETHERGDTSRFPYRLNEINKSSFIQK